MRPFSPFCGTVSNAQLLTLPATISTSAPGVVTTQLSQAPPASSSATDVAGSSDNRPATAQPPEPAPTMMKSNVSVTYVSPLSDCSLLHSHHCEEQSDEAIQGRAGDSGLPRRGACHRAALCADPLASRNNGTGYG